MTALEQACAAQVPSEGTVAMAAMKPPERPAEPEPKAETPLEVETAITSPAPRTTSLAPRKTARWAIAGAALLVAVAGAAVIAWRLHQPAPTPPATSEEAPPVASAPKSHAARPSATAAEAARPAANKVPLPDTRPAAREKQSYAVRLVSTPADAEITVDDKAESACHSPCTVELASGSHALRATKDGYQPLQKNFEVDSDVQEVPFVLEKAAGSLLIRTQPDGATISADGTVLASTTPTTIRLPMGRHRITLTKEGFAPYTFEATVDDLLPHSTSLTLAPAH